MPLARREFIQVSLLLLCVPAQHFISKYFSTNVVQRDVALKSLVTSFVDFKTNYLEWDSWWNWCLSLPSLASKIKMKIRGDPTQNESPAVEVMQLRGAGTGYFAESPIIRTPRPKNVKFRVGQVITHKESGYRGVIIGWDLSAMAPQSWLHKYYPKEKLHWRQMPHYLILVDIRDQKTPQKTYVPEEYLVAIKNVKIIHPELEDYFDAYESAKYLPRPALRLLYPED